MTLTRKYGALEHDAREWRESSGVFASSAGSVTDLGLEWQFGVLGDLVGLASSYEAARSHVEFLMNAGGREAERAADALMWFAADLGEVERDVAESFMRNGHNSQGEPDDDLLRR